MTMPLLSVNSCPSGLLTWGPTCQCFTKSICVPHEAEQQQKQHVVNLKKMREKRIQQWVKWWLLRPSNFFFSIITLSLQLNCGKGATLWFDASLLITTPAPWLGCFTLAALHCIPVWHVDPVAWCPTCRRKGLIRLQRIYNFWLLHAILSTILDIIGLYCPILLFWD